MVEKVNRKNETVWEAVHYPEGGGIKRATIEKAENGKYFLRIGFYDKSKNISESQVLSLSRAEISELALILLREMVGR